MLSVGAAEGPAHRCWHGAGHRELLAVGALAHRFPRGSWQWPGHFDLQESRLRQRLGRREEIAPGGRTPSPGV